MMFRCLYTNKPIPSGLDLCVPSVPEVSDYPISVQCPHCGLRHHGTVADGCLIDAMSDEPSLAKPHRNAPPTRPCAAAVNKR